MSGVCLTPVSVSSPFGSPSPAMTRAAPTYEVSALPAGFGFGASHPPAQDVGANLRVSWVWRVLAHRRTHHQGIQWGHRWQHHVQELFDCRPIVIALYMRNNSVV